MDGQSEAPTRFVLFFPGRTGSSYLIEALNSHPDIRAAPELLPRPRRGGGDLPILPSERGEWAARQERWLREFFGDLHERRTAEHSVIGFKTKLRDVADPFNVADVLREMCARIIVMRRRNIVKLVVSYMNSQRLRNSTGKWNLYTEKNRPGTPIHVDPSSFHKLLDEVKRSQDAIAEYVGNLDLPSLTVDYEDMLVNERATFDDVCVFLGVPAMLLQGKALKATHDDLRAAVANFEELRTLYGGTRYERMFDEVLVDPA